MHGPHQDRARRTEQVAPLPPAPLPPVSGSAVSFCRHWRHCAGGRRYTATAISRMIAA